MTLKASSSPFQLEAHLYFIARGKQHSKRKLPSSALAPSASQWRCKHGAPRAHQVLAGAELQRRGCEQPGDGGRRGRPCRHSELPTMEPGVPPCPPVLLPGPPCCPAAPVSTSASGTAPSPYQPSSQGPGRTLGLQALSQKHRPRHPKAEGSYETVLKQKGGKPRSNYHSFRRKCFCVLRTKKYPTKSYQMHTRPKITPTYGTSRTM